jgi:hypothetical protein
MGITNADILVIILLLVIGHPFAMFTSLERVMVCE